MKHLILFLIMFFCSLLTITKTAQAKEKENWSELFSLYKQLHQNPELSLDEKSTMELLAGKLKDLRFSVQTHFGGYGFVAVLKNGEGPTLMVRTDLDALPIKEETGLEFASHKESINPETKEKTPVMHACGHDVHMAVFIGTAERMKQEMELKHWSGTLIMIGQPAEERGIGALAMIEDGLFKKFPLPKAVLGLHTHPFIEAGNVGYHSGPIMAGTKSVNIRVFGIGGHGAMPHTTKDPIVLSANIITALQQITSREISPFEPNVITVGRIQGGTKRNVIPDFVDLDLTVRGYSDEVLDYSLKRIKEIAHFQAASFGLEQKLWPKVEILSKDAPPPLINDPQLSIKVREGLEKALGGDHVIDMEPLTPSEDFAYFGRTEHKIPIHFYFLGVAPIGVSKNKQKFKQLPGIHNSKYTPDYKNAIPTGVSSMSGVLLHLFKDKIH